MLGASRAKGHASRGRRVCHALGAVAIIDPSVPMRQLNSPETYERGLKPCSVRFARCTVGCQQTGHGALAPFTCAEPRIRRHDFTERYSRRVERGACQRCQRDQLSSRGRVHDRTVPQPFDVIVCPGVWRGGAVCGAFTAASSWGSFSWGEHSGSSPRGAVCSASDTDGVSLVRSPRHWRSPRAHRRLGVLLQLPRQPSSHDSQTTTAGRQIAMRVLHTALVEPNGVQWPLDHPGAGSRIRSCLCLRFAGGGKTHKQRHAEIRLDDAKNNNLHAGAPEINSQFV